MVCEAPPSAQPAPGLPPQETRREETQLALICIIEPRAMERARRLEFAIRHIRAGMAPPEVRMALRLQFNLAQPLAWRIVDMALDLAGPV